MNMQKKLYTINFFSPLNNRLRSQSLSSSVRTQNLWISLISQILWNSQKKDCTGKVWSPRQERIWIHGKENIPAPWPTPIYKLSMMSMVGNISIGQLGLAAWLCSLPAPAHLLLSWTGETGKSPWFHSNNWKYQCYQCSSRTKSNTQQLLRGKLTISQPKPGHPVSSWLLCGFILSKVQDLTFAFVELEDNSCWPISPAFQSPA